MRVAIPTLILVALAGTEDGVGQGVRIVSDAPTCKRCEVRLRPVLEIKANGALEDIGSNPAVIRDLGGRYYFAGASIEGIAEFDSTGRFVRMIGRRGAGPGEYSEMVVQLYVDDADSLHVFDLGIGRHSVLDKQRKYIRSERIPVIDGRQFVPVSGGWVGALRESDKRMVMTTENGKTKAIVPLVDRMVRDQALGPGLGGNFWIAAGRGYQLEQWSLDERLVKTLVRRPKWFVEARATHEIDKIPWSAVETVRQDSVNRVWVLVRAAHPDWKKAIIYERGQAAGLLLDKPYSVTTVEVIDPGTDSLVVSTALPIHIRGWVDATHVYGTRYDEDGNLIVRIFEIGIDRKRS